MGYQSPPIIYPPMLQDCRVTGDCAKRAPGVEDPPFQIGPGTLIPIDSGGRLPTTQPTTPAPSTGNGSTTSSGFGGLNLDFSSPMTWLIIGVGAWLLFKKR